jgi:HPt (histidine-containing phosphotransfer) domain-containing protein
MDITTAPVLNISELLARVEDDRELLVELFGIFRSLYPVHLERLREAIHLQSPEKLEHEGHTLKGMLSNLSAMRAAGVAAELEQMGRSKKLDGLDATLASFEREVESLLAQMEVCASDLQS